MGGLSDVFSGVREGAVQVPKWILDVLTGKKLRVHELRAPVWVGHRELMLLSMDVRDDENPLSLTAGVLGLFSAALADVFTWSRGSELSYPLTSANGDAWRVCVDAAVLAVIDTFSSELEVSVESFVSEAGIPWLTTLANNGFRPESVIRGTDEVFVATLLNLLKYEVKHRCGDRWKDVWRRLDR
ncbi:hypothetical protein [Methanopyrus sp. SNP6]|uniref:hypothetical protein n=1 Tax=Methanopyrus sp. SNP6 TaxID=1937005 RepID=UPI0011E5BB1B|nr:hypothetical protein [Methanopyrus sp. SNP6]